jgi:hypothetical protein
LDRDTIKPTGGMRGFGLAQNDTKWWREAPPVSRWLLATGILWGMVAVGASLLYSESMRIIVFLVLNTSFLPVYIIIQWFRWKAGKAKAL